MKRILCFLAAAVFVLITLLPRMEGIFADLKNEEEAPPVDLTGGEDPNAFKQYFSDCVEIGETFDLTFFDFSGTLRGTVTDIRLVSEEEDCPPREWFDPAVLATQDDGWAKFHYYEEWFTEGGAFDQGCRLILVDMSVENVDARAYTVDEGGDYYDPYVFMSSAFLDLFDLEFFYEQNEQFACSPPIGFSLLNSYVPTDPPENDSEPADPFDFVVEPGKTVRFTLVFPLQHNDDNTPQEVTKLVLGRQYSDRDTFYIELGLEGEA